MAFLTLAEYKVLAQISGTAQDTLLNAILPLVEADIQDFCNRDFAEGYPDALKIYAAKMVSYQVASLKQAYNSGLTSESQGGYSYTKAGNAESYLGYPMDVIGGLRRWRFISGKYGNIETQFRDRRWQSLYELAGKGAFYGDPGVVVDAD